MDERRRRILAAVEQWLDEHPDEPLPAGLDPALGEVAEAPDDLAALTAAITACRHDVQLQGKIFRRLEAALATALDAATGGSEADGDALAEAYDRLLRCWRGATAAGADLPWLVTRRRATVVLEGVVRGLELALARLRDMLSASGCEVFDPLGEDFDPQRMRAVGTEPRGPGQRSGEVVETLSVGRRRGDAIVRPAEVRIAK